MKLNGNKENKQKEKNNKRVEKKKINININFTYVAIILIAILCVCITPVTFQNDTYYTIKIGELISNNGIDMMDHFSWHPNLPYTYPHWLYDLLTYFIYSFAGFKGIYITTCVLSALLGISIFLVNSKLTKSKAIAFIVTLGAMYMLDGYITARAQLVTFILFIWEMFCIEKFLQNRKIIYGIILVLISLLIANMHVATWPFFFIVFLPYIGEYLICVVSDMAIYSKPQTFMLKTRVKILKGNKSKLEKNEKIKNKELTIQKYNDKIEKLNKKLADLEINISKVKIKREQDKEKSYKIIATKNSNVKFLIIIMIICALMGLITPTKDTPYTYLYKTVQGNTTDSITEHQPLTLSKDTDTMCMLIIFLAIMIFTKTKIKLSDLFLIAGLCYLMFATKRQISMFVLLGSVVLTRMLIDLVERYTKNGIEEGEKASKHIGVVLAVTVLVVLISYDYVNPKFDDKFVNSSSYPVEACDYIIENIDYKNARFYNEYNYGSYMLFRGIPVFIDSRADLYAPEFSGNKDEDVFTDFINTSTIAKFYEDTFEKYKITHVITTKKSKMNMIIRKTKDQNYKELYADDHFTVYERVNANK